jgi:tRNA 5-methylaminomethyl-2-thiouridine biosynthesis bifunctional protein
VLDWRDGQPFSRRFGDVYFSRTGGLEETRHVFLAGNRLAERFAGLAPGACFVIGETGFGTGLNFLCAWELFERTAPPGTRLHFVSTEIDPLERHELDRALRLWPALDAYRLKLVRLYSVPSAGWHRFGFAAGRVHLTLLIGDARQTLPALQGGVDAWFLDGFSPSRNPELWEERLLADIGKRSRPGASAATYSCAGSVRRGLAAAGFSVAKARGFGSKREMLSGRLEGQTAAAAARQRSAIVIGSGLAGAAAAYSLAQRGWQVSVIERNADIAMEASGNAQGVLYARLSAHGTPLSRLVLAGYQHVLRMLGAHMPGDGEAWSDCPVLQLAFDPDEAARQAAVAALELPAGLLRPVDASEASAVAGLPVEHAGLLFPGGGWVHPPALCRALLSQAGVSVHTGFDAEGLTQVDGEWEVCAGAGASVRAHAVVLAGGAACTRFAHAASLPLRVNRGQVTLLPATPASAGLRAVLCGERYATPARQGMHSIGATFAREESAEVRPAEHDENLAMLRRLSPSLFQALGAPDGGHARLAGRAGLRCVSPDYLPLVGPLDAPGLFISAAHGSRGLITAPLAGEVLAAWLADEPAPLPADMMQALHPQRFH